MVEMTFIFFHLQQYAINSKFSVTDKSDSNSSSRLTDDHGKNAHVLHFINDINHVNLHITINIHNITLLQIINQNYLQNQYQTRINLYKRNSKIIFMQNHQVNNFILNLAGGSACVH